MGLVVNATPRPVYPLKGPVTHCIKTWVSPWTDWMGAENFAPTWIRSSDCPARNQSMYRLSYPGPPFVAVRNLLIQLANCPKGPKHVADKL
jgi:hypothetical protein